MKSSNQSISNLYAQVSPVLPAISVAMILVIAFIYSRSSPEFDLLILNVCAILAAVFMIDLASRPRHHFLVTPGHLFLLVYISYLCIGIIIRYNQSPDEYAKTLRIISLGLFFFSCGVLFVSIYTHFNPYKEYSTIGSSSLCDTWSSPVFNHSLFLLYIIGLVLACLYFLRAGCVPLFLSAQQREIRRVEAFHGGGYFLLGITKVLPFVCLAIIGKAIVWKRRRLVLLCILSISVCSVLMIFTALKSLAPFFLLWIVFFLQFNSTRLSRRMVVLSCLVIIMTLALVGFTHLNQLRERGFHGTIDSRLFLSFAVERFVQRIFFDIADLTHLLVSTFGQTRDHLYGYSYYIDMAASLPGPDISFGGSINREYFHMGGAATVPLVAEFYVNFGELVTYIGMGIAGIVVQGFHVAFVRKLRRRKKLATLILATFLSMGLGFTWAGDTLLSYFVYTFAPIAGLVLFMRICPIFLKNIVGRAIRNERQA